jgi:L-fuconolactonase
LAFDISHDNVSVTRLPCTSERAFPSPQKDGYGWHERKRPPSSDELLAANRDWCLYMIDHFGPSRCFFESNFPVDKLSCSYTALWNQFKKLTNGFSAAERSAMFHDTAMRVYRLPLH